MLFDFISNPAEYAPMFITIVVTLIFAFAVHEFAHALVADRFGDTTPRAAGRLTLNPLAHLDPLGTLAFLMAGFGWAKPVPVNPYQLSRRSSAAMMLVSLAGPASNFIMALIAIIPLRLDILSNDPINAFLPSPYFFVSRFALFNLFLAFFNLIPLAPLDGDKIFEYFLPPTGVRVLEIIRPYSTIILLLILFVLPMLGVDVFGTLFFPPIYRLWNLLAGSLA